MNKAVSIIKEAKIKTLINSIIVGVMLTCGQLAMILDKEGIVVLTIIVCFMICQANNLMELKIKAKTLLLSITIIVAFFLCMLIFDQLVIQEYFLDFICFGLPFLLMPIVYIDYRITIISIFLISLLAIPGYITFDYGYGMLNQDSGTYESTALMTISYRLLPAAFSSFFIAISKQYGILRIIATISFVLFSTLLFVVGSRGALISYIVFFIFLFIFFAKSKVKHRKRVMLILCFTILFVSFFGTVVTILYNYNNTNDISVLAIDRLYMNLEGQGSFDTGRSSLYKTSIDNILGSPIWGNGIGSSNEFKEYPHNVFLQVFEEGGIMFFIPFLVVLVLGIRDLLRWKLNRNYFFILAFVFCSGMIQLFFSFQYWASYYFWSFIFLVIYRKEIVKYQSIYI